MSQNRLPILFSPLLLSYWSQMVAKVGIILDFTLLNHDTLESIGSSTK